MTATAPSPALTNANLFCSCSPRHGPRITDWQVSPISLHIYFLGISSRSLSTHSRNTSCLILKALYSLIPLQKNLSFSTERLELVFKHSKLYYTLLDFHRCLFGFYQVDPIHGMNSLYLSTKLLIYLFQTYPFVQYRKKMTSVKMLLCWPIMYHFACVLLSHYPFAVLILSL